MTIEIKPETEQLVQEALHKGHFASVDDLIVASLQAWNERTGESGEECRHTPLQAAARIRELRKGLSLGDLKIKNLINEGRR